MLFGLIKDRYVVHKHGGKIGTTKHEYGSMNLALWAGHYWAAMGCGDAQVFKNGKQIEVYRSAPESAIE
jgi:hypothetical protein